MKNYFKPLTLLWAIGLLVGLAACSESNEPSNKTFADKPNTAQISLDVYKSPDCGCCADWVDHVEAAGFETLVHHPSDLGLIKQKHGIASSYQACHTAVSNQGHVFEGHVPAYLIQRFLNNPPQDAIGLAVPGMPFGSPGMEMGDRYDDYRVLLIKKDGSSEVYEEIVGAAPNG